ncbi:ankyrin protein [Fusarium sp. NRRL 25303]|nr:ankyrin protein [Fusarium sp. NRRL 25303]
MSRPHDYIVGWICALHIEYVAAKTFLDEKHDPPEFVSTNDNNLYTLGKIGKHNTVIAILPHGEYGIAPAASVARDMLHSFPNIRIGLMVGIGGGAPSPKHDIRLGDIVVSASDNGKHGGVFNFDHGKVIQGQPFEESGFLNQSPVILRTAVQGLRAEYEAEGHQLERAINEILDQKRRLRKKYGRPRAITDRLYQPWVLHQPHDDPNCDLCSKSPSSRIVRSQRASDEDNPTIHYGLIASSNKLMKDATIRDELAKKGVLCFETEAAGLMNHFPCLVIRGICDYADTHKNDEWQGYAAMAAAAYAKDLLCQIQPNRAEAEAKISENEVSATTRKVNTIIHHHQTRENKDILQWLTPASYSLLQSDNIGRRQPGTGQWFMDSSEFCHWRDSPNQTLFCPGIPGAGKTILTSIVINSLEDLFSNDKTVGIAYVYCNFQRQNDQTAKELLASLLKQLLQSLPAIPESIKLLYQRHKNNGSPPLLEDISSKLLSATKLFSRVFIIVDALDECRITDGTRKKFLEEIFKLQLHSKANVFITSRPMPDVKDQFQTSITLEVRATDADVERFLRGQMPQLPSFFRRDGLEELVISQVVRSVKGMFLLAQLHLDSLRSKISVDAVHKALASLPSGSDAYFQAYETAMERIMSQSPSHRDLAKQVIAWTVCAMRPLTIEELRHALAVEVDKAELNRDALPETSIILRVCVGLVTVGESDGIIRLVHYTTQEYFEKTKMTWFPEAESEITTTCVTYLKFQEFKSGICPNDEALRKRLEQNPLFYYASHHWGDHARNAKTICKGVIEFLKSDSNVESSAQSLMAREGYLYSDRVPKNMKGLHLAAYFGDSAATQILLLENDIDLEDGHNRTALSYAVSNQHLDVTILLLENGAYID